MKTFDAKSKLDLQDVRIIVLSEKQLHDLITAAMGAALQDPEFLKSCEGGEVQHMLSRKAASDLIGVSLSTLDRISQDLPDILPKRRHASGKPFFLKKDVERYMQFKGYSA